MTSFTSLVYVSAKTFCIWLLYFGFSFGPLVENIKDVYSIQQLKQLMEDPGSNPQQFPTLGIVYAFLTSFDIDSDFKPIIASRWWVQFTYFSFFSVQIKLLGFRFSRGQENWYNFFLKSTNIIASVRLMKKQHYERNSVFLYILSSFFEKNLCLSINDTLVASWCKKYFLRI